MLSRNFLNKRREMVKCHYCTASHQLSPSVFFSFLNQGVTPDPESIPVFGVTFLFCLPLLWIFAGAAEEARFHPAFEDELCLWSAGSKKKSVGFLRAEMDIE